MITRKGKKEALGFAHKAHDPERTIKRLRDGLAVKSTHCSY